MESRQSSCPSLVLVTQRHDGDNDGVGTSDDTINTLQYCTYLLLHGAGIQHKEVKPSRPRTIPLPLYTTTVTSKTLQKRED
jgi:hypothetical protein